MDSGIGEDGDADFKGRRKVRAAETGGGDAHDGRGQAVQEHLPAGDIGRELKLVLPHVPGDYGREPGGAAIFLRGEAASLDDGDAEDVEVIGSDRLAAKFVRALGGGHGEALESEGGDGLESAGVRQEFGKDGEGYHIAIGIAG